MHYLSQLATRELEGARDIVKKFLNAASDKEVIFTKGTTDGINLVANSYGRKFIKAGDEIIISALEHHANIVPWQMLCEQIGAVLRVIPINDDGELLMDEYEKLLNPKTKFVSVNYVSNALGTINPVKRIIELAHAQDIPVPSEASQGWRLRLSTDAEGYGGSGLLVDSIAPSEPVNDVSDAPKRLLATPTHPVRARTVRVPAWSAAVYVRDLDGTVT